MLYDLDIEAAAVARELKLPLARASSVNVHPRFIAALQESVNATADRYGAGRPLPIV